MAGRLVRDVLPHFWLRSLRFLVIVRIGEARPVPLCRQSQKGEFALGQSADMTNRCSPIGGDPNADPVQRAQFGGMSAIGTKRTSPLTAISQPAMLQA